MTGTIRILIADDHTIVRKGLRTLLESEPGLESPVKLPMGRRPCCKRVPCIPISFCST